MKMILSLVVVAMLGAVVVGCNKETATDTSTTTTHTTNTVTSTNK